MSSPFESPGAYRPPKRRSAWPYVLGGCGLVTVLMLAACGGMLFLGYRQVSQNGDVALEVDRLFEAVAQGQMPEYYQQHCSPEFRQATSEADLVRLAAAIQSQLGPLQSKSVTGFSFKNHNFTNYVDAQYACEFEHGAGTVDTKFKQHGDGWQLVSFRVDSPQLNLNQLPTGHACPHCGQQYPDGAAFCPHCGQKVPASAGAGGDDAGETTPGTVEAGTGEPGTVETGPPAEDRPADAGIEIGAGESSEAGPEF